jgi:hypothetical protein
MYAINSLIGFTSSTFLLIFFVSPQSGIVISQNSLSWLKDHARKAKVRCGYRCPPMTSHKPQEHYAKLPADCLNRIQTQLATRLKHLIPDSWNETINHSKRGRKSIVAGITRAPQRAQHLSFTASFRNASSDSVTSKHRLIHVDNNFNLLNAAIAQINPHRQQTLYNGWGA